MVISQKQFFGIVVLLLVAIILAVIFTFTHNVNKPGLYAFPVPGHHTYGKSCTTSRDCSPGEICEGANRLNVQAVCALDYKPNF
jgi:hypothetical protein